MRLCYLPLLDAILACHRSSLGQDFAAYRNHVHRVVWLTEAVRALSEVEREQVEIAAAFHDLAIWTHNTFDYLPMSMELARSYLREREKHAWEAQVVAMIGDHHKFRAPAHEHAPLADAFRKADWIDVSFGLLRMGAPALRVREIQRAFPDEGFHTRLLKLTMKQMLITPWRPLPMLKW